MKLLFRLLSQNVSIWQTLAFAIANLIGAVVVLAGWAAYRDVQRVFDESDSFLSSNYVVINKPVSTATTAITALGGRPAFSDDEIQALSEQPGVSSVGSFTAALFDVSGVISFEGTQMSTQMFLESVPDAYLDTSLGKQWSASVDDDFVPVVLPHTYLNLYNYGFASSQGLPQISQELIERFPLTLVLSGGGERHRYTARVVDFSNRLNTILVPDDFLREANERFSTTPAPQPSRLIIATETRRLSSSLIEYLEDHNYEMEGNSADSLRMQALIYGIVWGILGLGLVMTLLACFLLIVSINLLIEKDRERLETLSSIGYERRAMAMPYVIMALSLDAFTWIGGAFLAALIYPYVTRYLQTLLPDFVATPFASVWLLALVLAAAFFVVHLLTIRKGTK